jgi:hypothetical protein
MATATQAANLFELSCDGTQITYSTSSIDGQPRFSYSGPDGDHSFAGDEIDTQATALHTEVTVTLETIPDLRTVTLTLLLGSFKLDADLESEFATLAIKTTNHTTIAGPPTGPAQSYEAIALHGVAKSVVF